MNQEILRSEKKAYAPMGKKEAKKIATPPNLGIASVWIFLGLGRSYAPSLIERFSTRGVKARDRSKDAKTIRTIII